MGQDDLVADHQRAVVVLAIERLPVRLGGQDQVAGLLQLGAVGRVGRVAQVEQRGGD